MSPIIASRRGDGPSVNSFLVNVGMVNDDAQRPLPLHKKSCTAAKGGKLAKILLMSFPRKKFCNFICFDDTWESSDWFYQIPCSQCQWIVCETVCCYPCVDYSGTINWRFIPHRKGSCLSISQWVKEGLDVTFWWAEEVVENNLNLERFQLGYLISSPVHTFLNVGI